VKDERPAPPQIDGYASMLERKIDGVPVVDSVAWARLNERFSVAGSSTSDRPSMRSHRRRT
jgi:hypothetical protein